MKNLENEKADDHLDEYRLLPNDEDRHVMLLMQHFRGLSKAHEGTD